MDPVSNSDRLVRLLRQKLQQRARARVARPSGTTGPGRADAVRGVANQMARAGDGNDAQLRRALVEQLLAERFDGALTNDAQFQQIVSDVTELMRDDPAIEALLATAVTHLREAST